MTSVHSCIRKATKLSLPWLFMCRNQRRKHIFILSPDPEPVIQLEQSPPNMTQYYAGYDLALSCLVSVSPEVVGRVSITATWSKDDREYSNNWDSRISVSPPSLTSDDGVYATSLSFTPLDSRDTGSYQCMAVLTSYTGVPLANATVTTSLTVEG